MSESPKNACSNPEVNSLFELAKDHKKVEFTSRLSQDMANQSPADTLKFLQQLRNCLDEKRSEYPDLPHVEIQKSAPPPGSYDI